MYDVCLVLTAQGTKSGHEGKKECRNKGRKSHWLKFLGKYSCDLNTKKKNDGEIGELPNGVKWTLGHITALQLLC